MTRINELRQRIALISKKGKHELKTREEREKQIDKFYDTREYRALSKGEKPLGKTHTYGRDSLGGPVTLEQTGEVTEHGKRFTKDKLESRKKDKKLGREHKQLDEGLANEQYIETGEPINPSKFKGKRININLKRRLARIYES